MVRVNLTVKQLLVLLDNIDRISFGYKYSGKEYNWDTFEGAEFKDIGEEVADKLENALQDRKKKA